MNQHDKTKREPPKVKSKIAVQIEELESRPHRHPFLHWTAFLLSLLSFIMLLTWVASIQGPVAGYLLLLDIGLGVVFAIEFFTRSGFRWNRAAYLRTRLFDFVAIVPALALVHHGFIIQEVWVWLILVARGIRVVDRFLGDGFVTRNVLALVEGFEEEITDRVQLRIMARIQTDMDNAGMSHGVAEALANNKSAILQRVRVSTSEKGIAADLAHIVGLDAAIERAEARVFDAIVGVIDSQEIDNSVRAAVNSSFSRMRAEIGKRNWLQHLGIRR